MNVQTADEANVFGPFYLNVNPLSVCDRKVTRSTKTMPFSPSLRRFVTRAAQSRAACQCRYVCTKQRILSPGHSQLLTRSLTQRSAKHSISQVKRPHSVCVSPLSRLPISQTSAEP